MKLPDVYVGIVGWIYAEQRLILFASFIPTLVSLLFQAIVIPTFFSFYGNVFFHLSNVSISIFNTLRKDCMMAIDRSPCTLSGFIVVFKLLSLVTPAQSLTEEHHFEVFSHLNKLSKEELVRVGTALGLLFRNCTDMSKDQIVTAWLKGNDNVVKDERDSRTWDALITALKKCGNNGIAKDVQEVAKACTP